MDSNYSDTCKGLESQQSRSNPEGLSKINHDARKMPSLRGAEGDEATPKGSSKINHGACCACFVCGLLRSARNDGAFLRHYEAPPQPRHCQEPYHSSSHCETPQATKQPIRNPITQQVGYLLAISL